MGDIKTDVSTPSAAYAARVPDWDMIEALLGGTRAMRDAGTAYLPKHRAEEDEDHRYRLSRAILHNYFKSTVRHLAGKIFAKEPVLQNDVPTQIREFCEDLDMQGSHLAIMAPDALRGSLSKGIHYLLVEYPRTDGIRTLADERASGARPYVVSLPAESVIGVRLSPDGRTIIQARIRENATVPDGAYGETTAERVRVLSPGAYEVWERVRKGQTEEWAMVENGTTSLPRVPLVPLYGERTGAFLCRPPLLDLAYMNVAYWQDYSDYANAITVASFPILAASGWKPEEDPKVVLSPFRFLSMTDPGGKFYYLEHAGTAINAGRTRLQDLKVDMAMEGLQFQMPRATGSDVTATESEISNANSTSDLRRMSIGVKDALENVLQIMAEWIGLKDGGSIQLQGAFSMPGESAEDIKSLMQMQMGGIITKKTLLAEAVRRGLLPEEFDAEAELEMVDSEGPDLTEPAA